MKIYMLLFLLPISNTLCAQSVAVVSTDTSFPVVNTISSIYSGLGSPNGTNVAGITSKNGVYYLIGTFTHLTKNEGSALVLDTVSKTIKNTGKWRIDGQVNAAIADGQGGFYIGGIFTHIGDSIRKNLAHINSTGQPLAWQATSNNGVTALYKRNDSLFISGSFTQVSGKYRYAFAIYSLGGDSLYSGSSFAGTRLQVINRFLIKKDTLVVAGMGYGGEQSIRKFNFRTNTLISWQANGGEYNTVTTLAFNADSSIVLYGTNQLLGVNYSNGVRRYRVEFAAVGASSAFASSVFVAGNKAYATGFFDIVYPGAVSRKGFVTFDATTGALLPGTITVNGYCHFVTVQGPNVYVSGTFNTVNGVARQNYVVLDTSSLAVLPGELSPGDRIYTHCFSNENLFIAGDFNGINAVYRFGFAAIDSVTKEVLPWNPVSEALVTEVKRAIIRGDTLFLLDVVPNTGSCVVFDYVSKFRMFRLSTGAQLYPVGFNYQQMYDFIVDSVFLYASVDNNLKRYRLPALTVDATWSATFNNQLTPSYLTATADKIIAIADNRFLDRCTSLRQRAGYIIKLPKTANPGAPVIYTYAGSNSGYGQIAFEHSLLVNQRLFIQGYFSLLNGNTRTNFACMNVDDGSVTPWQASSPFQGNSPYSAFRTSALKLYNGQVWLGGPPTGNYATDTTAFSGIGYIDTLTGRVQNLEQASPKLNLTTQYRIRRVSDFLFSGNRLMVAGGFDSLNTTPVCNISSQRITINYPPVTYTFTGSGNWSDPANWTSGMVPPAVLPSGSNIVINPSGTGECVLNIMQTVLPNCKLTVAPGKKLILPQNLKLY